MDQHLCVEGSSIHPLLQKLSVHMFIYQHGVLRKEIGVHGIIGLITNISIHEYFCKNPLFRDDSLQMKAGSFVPLAV